MGLAALWLAAGCGPAEPAKGPQPEAVHIAPAPEPSATASAGSEAAPAGYIPMHIGSVSDDEDAPHVVLEGAPGSFVAFRPESGLSEVAAAALFFVSRQVGQVARAFMKNELSPQARESYEKWSREVLANGGAFLRAEFSLRRDASPEGGAGQMRLLVRRGGRVDAVDPGDNAIPVILLHKIPLFVEIKLLDQIGGMKSD